MFKLVSVELTNFRSWAGTHRWELSQKAGLYFLTGRNYDNPRLGRNGIGKSSLLDAICFCLYGKTTRSRRGPNCINRGHDSCSVSCILVVGDDEFVITRTQSPNSLKIDGITVDQEAVTKKVRLNYESFLYAIISPQGNKSSFLDLSPGDKLNLFSELMELNYWLERSEKADKEAKAIDKKRELVETRLISLETKANYIATTIDELKVKSKQFEDNKAKNIQLLSEKYEHFSDKLMELNKQMDSIKLPCPIEMHALEKEIEEYEDEEKQWIVELNETTVDIAKIDAELNFIGNEIKKLKEVGAKCPTCKQKVDSQHLTKESSKFEKKKLILEETKSDYEALLIEIKTKKSLISTAVATVETKLVQFKTEDRKSEQEKNKLEYQIHGCEQTLAQIIEDTKKIKASINEFAQVIGAKRNELVDVNQSIEETKTEIAKLHEDYTAVHYWVAGFKRIRLYIIEETLRGLEIEVNNALATLGMGDWKIEFDIERENKSGGVTKGFTTLITDPKGNTAPYEDFSFGENQRVRLAGSFGLADLIMERAGLFSVFEAYDEVSQHMSIEGIEDTLNLLRDRATQKNKKIILVDHQAIEYGDFSGVINIVRDENGSRFA